MEAQLNTTQADVDRYRNNYLVEMDGIALYRSMAAAEKDEKRAAIFEKLAQNEERHAQRWARLIQSAGGVVPAHRPTARVRMLAWIARQFGTRRVLPIISSLEARDEAGYMAQPEAAGLPAEERSHSRTLRAMEGGLSGQEAIIGVERWHYTSRGGSLRAAVFGINDGLVSNFSLVMGFAGAEAKPEYVLLAGVAGLLAGSFSMAAGEYVSMRAQRELFEQQIAMEQQELEMSPKEEEEELSLIYQAKGIPEQRSGYAGTADHRESKNCHRYPGARGARFRSLPTRLPMERGRKFFCGFRRRRPCPGAPLSIRCRASGVDRQRFVQLPCAVWSRSPAFDLYRSRSAAERSKDAGDRIAGLRNYLHRWLAARGVRCGLRAKLSTRGNGQWGFFLSNRAFSFFPKSALS